MGRSEIVRYPLKLRGLWFRNPSRNHKVIFESKGCQKHFSGQSIFLDHQFQLTFRIWEYGHFLRRTGSFSKPAREEQGCIGPSVLRAPRAIGQMYLAE